MEESTVNKYTNKISESFSKAVDTIKKTNPRDVMRNLNQNMAVVVINVFLVIAIVFMFWNMYYNTTLEKKLCKKVNAKYEEMNGKISSITAGKKVAKDAPNNFEYYLNDYYIKSAYNACSVGNYQNSAVSLCILKDILKQGVRCLDFEIYSIDNNPIVATSVDKSYFVKETFNYVPFANVLLTLRDYAFSASGAPNPRDPIIIHLRIKSSNQKMFSNMANMFRKISDVMLGKDYSFENHGKNLGRTPVTNYLGKIIVVADKSYPDFLESKALNEFINMTSNSIFMRALRFTKDVKLTPDVAELKTYNKQNFTIVLPDDTIDPDNPNPLLSRNLGCQMVAMRYQKPGASMNEDMDFFSQHGHAFVLKPKELRYIPVFIDKPKPPNKKLSYKPRNVGNKSGLYKFDI